MRLTARYADMWNIYYDDTKNQPSRLAPFREMVDEACRDVGRDPATMERTATMLVAGPDVDPWWSRLPSGRADAIVPFTGGPEALAEELDGLRPRGDLARGRSRSTPRRRRPSKGWPAPSSTSSATHRREHNLA